MTTSERRPDPAQDDARVAGRGFLFITFAKLYFIATGALISLGLPRILGDAAQFGDFSVVNSLISIINMVMIAGTIQAVSKAVSERDGVAGAVRRTAILAQSTVGLPVFLLFFLGADWIAEVAFKDAQLGLYVRVGSLVILFYCYYAIFVGLFNGQKRFLQQASLDVTFSTLKTFGVVGLVALGFGVLGAFSGFAGAAFLILCIAGLATRRITGGGREDAPFRRILLFMAPVMLYTFLVNVLLQADRLMLKSLQFEPLLQHFQSGVGQLQAELLAAPFGGLAALGGGTEGLLAAFARQGTSLLSGYFGAVKNVSFLPYQSIIAITFVIFPLVSRSTFENDVSRTRAYVSQTFRYSLLLLTLMIVALVATSADLIHVLFGAEYAVADGCLSLLLIAIVAFSLFYVGNTIVTGAGRPLAAALIGLVTALVNVGLIAWFLSGAGLWRGALEATALGTTIAMFLGLAIVGVYLFVRFRAFAPLGTVVRVVALGAVIAWGARQIPVHGFVGLVVKAGVAAVAFLVALVLTGEFGREDRARLMRVLGRAPKAGAGEETAA